MKYQNFIKSFFLLFTTILFFSCGGDDDSGGGGNGNVTVIPVTSITIQADKTTVEEGELITLTTKTNTNTNITVESTFYVDGVAISGFVFTPTNSGIYSVYAKFNSLTSSSINITVNEAPRIVLASSDSYKELLGEKFTFSAITNGSVDITSEATFYIDGTEITGNEYTPSERGRYALTAKYDDVTSSEVFVTIGYLQKVLVEDYTGTWCGYCPRLAYNLEQTEIQSEDVYGVAVHNGDPMAYEYEAQMRAQYGVSGFPSGRINRTISWNESVAQVLSYTGVSGDLGLGLETSLSGSTISVDVKVGYVNTINNAKVIVYLLEDGLLYNQVNYMNNDSSSPWYQTGNPIPNFVHNNVLRKAFTDIFGDTMPNAVSGNEYTGNFTLTMPGNVQDTSKLEIVAFIVDSSGKAMNAMRVDLGDSQDYQ